MVSTPLVRRMAALSLAAFVAALPAGCSTPEHGSAPTSETTAAAEGIELSRLSELRDDMPPGFVPFDAEVKKLHHAYVASVGSVVSKGKAYWVDPPQCSTLLKPVNGVAGSDSIGFLADGPQDQSIGVGAYAPLTSRLISRRRRAIG
ncbi:hypothetical protein ABGB19_08060 [Mycobacterium sp. B14F4]|uniref:hypothetical protein n=1 Tax=Mycobacterium sp. B14F4 TaxID=3153565 RepID=UPI00325EA998